MDREAEIAVPTTVSAREPQSRLEYWLELLVALLLGLSAVATA